MIEEETKLDDCIETLKMIANYIDYSLNDEEADSPDPYYILYLIRQTLKRVTWQIERAREVVSRMAHNHV